MKLRQILNQKPWLILWLMIFVYLVVFSAICIFKYYQFGYNGLDLAIYNQVFYNSVHGQLFNFTIHPSSYLGDHLELFILFLLPLYYFFQNPQTLLILQTLILAMSAWPIFLIAKQKLSVNWSLLIACLWLLNPYLQNINLFEFHLLPFAIIFVLFAFYFYQQNRWLAFLLSCFLALLVREDVPLVIFIFSILAWIDKKSLKWKIWPAVISTVWFIGAIKIIDYFTPAGTYKFLYYYAWLGNSPLNMATNFFLLPLNTLNHIFSISNILFTFLLFLPVCYLNLIKPKYLLLAFPIYAQIILGGSSNATLALKLHYSSLLLPAVFISLIYSIKALFQVSNFSKLSLFLSNNRNFLIIILIVSSVYGLIVLGPLPSATQHVFQSLSNKQELKTKKEFINLINPQDSLATTYEFLTFLSGRKQIYSMHYAFIGKKQFTNLPYNLPNDVNKLLIDTEDFLTYGVKFPNSRQWRSNYQSGDERLRDYIAKNNFKPTKVVDSLVLWEKSAESKIFLYQIETDNKSIEHPQDLDLNNGLKFLGWSKLKQDNNGQTNILPISLYFTASQKIDDNWQLKLNIKNKNGLLARNKTYALAYGLYPTSNWLTGQIIKINYWFKTPDNLPATYDDIIFNLVNDEGFLTINGLRTAVIKITNESSSPEFFLK